MGSGKSFQVEVHTGRSCWLKMLYFNGKLIIDMGMQNATLRLETLETNLTSIAMLWIAPASEEQGIVTMLWILKDQIDDCFISNGFLWSRVVSIHCCLTPIWLDYRWPLQDGKSFQNSRVTCLLPPLRGWVPGQSLVGDSGGDSGGPSLVVSFPRKHAARWFRLNFEQVTRHFSFFSGG